jgi:ribosomal protein L37AE/L43A
MSDILENIKKRSLAQKSYGGSETNEAKAEAKVCPNCGAPRAKRDGLTRCAYCGYSFVDTVLDDGIFIKKEDNSK